MGRSLKKGPFADAHLLKQPAPRGVQIAVGQLP